MTEKDLLDLIKVEANDYDLKELELCRKKVWEIHMMLVHLINAEMENKKKS